jgi:hypothetical protein
VNDITKQLAEALRDLLNAADCYGMPFNDPARKAAREALRLYEQAKPAEPVTDKQLLAEAEFAESYDASAPSFMSLLRDDAVVGDFQRRLLICMRAAVKLAAPVAQAEPLPEGRIHTIAAQDFPSCWWSRCVDLVRAAEAAHGIKENQP